MDWNVLLTLRLGPRPAHDLHALASARGRALEVDFDDPDFLVAIEAVDQACGIAPLPRSLRERYSFVRAP